MTNKIVLFVVADTTVIAADCCGSTINEMNQ